MTGNLSACKHGAAPMAPVLPAGPWLWRVVPPVDIVRHLPDEEATARLAAELAAIVRSGDVIALWGDLGTGKTTFARAFIRSRGRPDEEVPSPTFTLVQIYEPGRGYSGTVFHFDLFRIESPEEVWELGLEEAFAEGISLIEWPDRLGALLPASRLDVRLSFCNAAVAREVVISVGAGWPERLAGWAR
jgi:tRNA threonylcarbamoyladenosine biosynthesis protein TsaE